MNLEVVTSYYNDLHRLNWQNVIGNSKLTVYHKNDQLKIGEYIDGNHIEIPNFGRCDYAFILHIIKNYDNLSDVTLFTKINWKDQPTNFPLLVNECLNYDYAEVGFEKESYWWHDDINNSPPKNIKIHHRVDTTETKFFKKTNSKLYHIYYDPDCMNDWYKHIYDNGSVPGIVYAFSHGPCFSVSKRLIQRHPIEVYQYLLDRFHPYNSWNNVIAKQYYAHKHPDGVTDEHILKYIGHHYHDQLLRFWRVLFTHRADTSLFKIRPS